VLSWLGLYRTADSVSQATLARLFVIICINIATFILLNHTFITVAEEVMLLLIVFVCQRITKNYSNRFHKIRWKGGTWATKETIRFCW